MTNTCVNPDCCAERHLHGTEGHECVPREVRDQAYLCGPCRGRLGRMLAELPSLYEELTESLTTARRKVSARGRSKGLSLEPIVVKAREHLVAWLSGWVRIVAEERGAPLPQTDAVDAACHWLGRHADWLAHQPYADEVLTNLAECHREATRARQIVPPRRFELKLPDGFHVPCPEVAEGPVLPGDAKPLCQGMMWADMRDESPLPLSEIFCDADPSHRWGTHQWMAFGLHVRPELGAREQEAVGA